MEGWRRGGEGPGVGCRAAVAPRAPHSKLGASPVFGKMPLKFHSLESLGQRGPCFHIPWALQIV